MLLIGFLISVYIAYGALSRGALTAGGAICAVLVGTTLFGLGGGVPGLALIGFFLTSTALSRHRRAEKQRLCGSLLEKGDQRDALQVLANGGPAALFALLYGISDLPCFYVGALGALAAATADTWATEIGLLSPSPPRHVLRWQEVPAGTSGAVSSSGLWGMLLGALFIGVISVLEVSPGYLMRAIVVVMGGIVGGMGDTMLGAAAQEQRQCLDCGAATEQIRHACSRELADETSPQKASEGETVVIGGVPGLNNDAVNGIATAWGGTVAAIIWAFLGR